MNNQYKYYAFISYSHLDKKWSEWLISSIEKFKVPKDLIGKEANGDTIPKKISPIFRDEDELPTNSNLGNKIEEELKLSKYLIVICSPNSAKSIWVDKEIRVFKKLHGEGRVLPIIVDGEPNASDKPQLNKEEAFPKSLKYKVDTNGNITNNRVEPIAADTRDEGGGKNRAKIKLIAGILGVGFDELWKREEKRRKKNIVIYSIVGIITTIVVTITIFYIYTKNLEQIYLQERLELTSKSAKLIFGDKSQKEANDKKYFSTYLYGMKLFSDKLLDINKTELEKEMTSYKANIRGDLLFNQNYDLIKQIKLKYNGELLNISFLDNNTLTYIWDDIGDKLRTVFDIRHIYISYININSGKIKHYEIPSKCSQYEEIKINYSKDLKKINIFGQNIWNDGKICFETIDIKSGQTIFTKIFNNFFWIDREVAISPDNKYIAMIQSNPENSISILDIKKDEYTYNYKIKEKDIIIQNLHFLGNDEVIYTIHSKSGIVILDLKTNNKKVIGKNFKNPKVLKVYGDYIVADTLSELYFYDLKHNKIVGNIKYEYINARSSDMSTQFQTKNRNFYATISFCNICSSNSTGER